MPIFKYIMLEGEVNEKVGGKGKYSSPARVGWMFAWLLCTARLSALLLSA